MTKRIWLDRLLSLARSEDSRKQDQSEGLVLSGGGSRASFQLGALRYLYDNCQIAPASIVGTSAGSIVGAMLAQSLDPGEQSRQLQVLEDYWLAMKSPAEMFTEQAWFAKLREQWNDISDVIVEHEEPESIFVDSKQLDPHQLVQEALEYDPSSNLPNDFNIGVAWQVLSSLGRIGKVGAGLASTWRGAERAASAYRPGPIVHRLLFESGFSSEAVRTSGVQLRLATVGLNSGELHYVREDGIMVDRDDQPIRDTPIELALGIWASCSIPGVFRPIRIGDELYVDGGVRENVPVEMAVSQLGVDKPYVIVSAPPDAVTPSVEARDIISVMMRSLAILFDETIQDEVAWARHSGAIVIEPLISVHGPMDVDHSLLRINRDYGWMRAAEVITGAEPGTTGPIVEARLVLWKELKDNTDARMIKRARRDLRTAMKAADASLLPNGAQAWPEETWA